MITYKTGNLLEAPVEYPSRLEWVESGLNDLRTKTQDNDIKSIALPRLGCGNGRLDWGQVRPIIEKEMSDLDMEVLIYFFS